MPDDTPIEVAPPAVRQPRPGSPQRRVTQRVFFTHAEWQAIAAGARACGRPASAFVREASLQALPGEHSPVGHAFLIRELGRCGAALAKLVATAPGAPSGAVSLETALAELVAVLRRFDRTDNPPAAP